MNDLLQTFNQLDDTQQGKLLAYAESLLAQQKTRPRKVNLIEWKEKIKTVSTWSKEDISIFEENRKKLNQWKIPQW